MPPALAPAAVRARPAQPALRDVSARPARLPNRYRTRDGVLSCLEAPTLAVRVERGFSVTAAAARSHAPGAIFLDGAAQGPPFVDAGRAVYNLDHHEGCVRPFTLATCEQAMVLLRRGLDLGRRDWTVYANDADLDTVLAIWVLLNHLRLGADDTLRAAIMPLLRLEGCIDAHGLGKDDLCALEPEQLALAHERMARLREKELSLKAGGHWEQVDLLAYVADRLRALDALVYSPEQLDDVEEIEELARADLGNGSVAVVCRAKQGIYEVETQLRRIHGTRLGVIALQKGPTCYSLRQVDPALGADLEAVYSRLNLVDPGSGGGRSADRWGGSPEIGGSPRLAGTRLAPGEIAEVCGRVHRKPGARERLATIATTGLAAALLVLAAAVPLRLEVAGAKMEPPLAMAGLLLAFSAWALLGAGRRAPGLYGLRPPSGLDAWALLPLALGGALMGGAWVPVSMPSAALLLSLPFASELLFRGFVHGRLASSFAIQGVGGPWFVSVPVLVSAALFALCTTLLPIVSGSAAGAFVLGVAAGMARERSESLIPAVALHALGMGALLLL